MFHPTHYSDLDHCLVAERWRSIIVDVRSYMTANVQTDHFPLVVSLSVKLGAPAQRKTGIFRAKPRFCEPGAPEKYAAAVQEGLAADWQATGTVQSSWDLFRSTAQALAEQCFQPLEGRPGSHGLPGAPSP
eukprot:6527631-Alexandrium_andersonii.AAC.1